MCSPLRAETCCSPTSAHPRTRTNPMLPNRPTGLQIKICHFSLKAIMTTKAN